MATDILHLSDLHITDGSPDQTLETLWNAPRSALGTSKFDFIVISGDLSQKSGDDEYTALSNFASNELLPLLKRNDKRRIICVPGNHDVTWYYNPSPPYAKAPFPDALPTDDQDIKKLDLKQKSFLRRPTRCDYRVYLEKGFLQFCEITPDIYCQRFANVQKFFNMFYNHIPENDRNFDLLALPEEGKDLSLHLFREEGLAFFGFNSCYCNDQYWRGAHISPYAITTARTLSAHLDGLLLIAVWHHGLAAEQSDPGYLGLFDLQRIHNVGCTIGFHGHTHQASAEVSGALRGKLEIISTGSLAAGADERPDAIGNQFSIVRMSANQLMVSVYSRLGEEFRRGDPSVIPLPGRSGDGISGIFVDTHRRIWEVGHDAIARTTVQLEGVRSIIPNIPLAIVKKPYNKCQEEKLCYIDNALVVVDRAEINGALHFTVVARDADKLTWHLETSNAVAVYKEDLAIGGKRSLLHPHIHDDEDAVAHHVRYETENLELSLTFSRPPADSLPLPHMADVRGLIEEREVKNGEIVGWVPIKTQAIPVTLDETKTHACLKVHRPRTGYRYSIVYKPASSGTSDSGGIRRKVNAIAGEMIQIFCERCVANIERQREQLARHIAEMTKLTLTRSDLITPGKVEEAVDEMMTGNDDQMEGNWCCFLWESNVRKLIPVLGQFPTAGWSSFFAAGDGVAGHAFRFNNPVSSCKEAVRRRSLIDADPGNVAGRWVLCVPLVAQQGGPSAGVIRFEGSGSEKTGTGRELRGLAVELCQTGSNDDAKEKVKNLMYSLSNLFWLYAQKILSKHSTPHMAKDAGNFAKTVTSANLS